MLLIWIKTELVIVWDTKSLVIVSDKENGKSRLQLGLSLHDICSEIILSISKSMYPDRYFVIEILNEKEILSFFNF